MRIAALAALVVSVVVAAPAVAQEESNPLSLTIGDQISLREPLAGGRILRGTVSRIDPDAITYTVKGDHRLYFRPYAMIDTIDVRRRVPRASARSWALWGGFLGAAAGLIGGPFYAIDGSIETGPAAALFGTGGGLGGAAIGAALGAILSPPRWYRHVFE